ncbi:sulfatase [Rhodopirellula sp. MGV]|uniref:sulfatase family protein n=1 Tax=Rhodopirellula sp. MGV TaxID=2023130 RepID=UPI000B97C4FB|nr:sulfatase [Rhodopirellula sp. MGV]OYP36384.1 sulfatase [Rhodopirellula sp. MGV]PNY38383.1 sulfatase [Rhodopirellula baltica]
MTRNGIFILALVLCSAWLCRTTAFASDRPNIVMAFADDWGKYASVYAKASPGGPSDIVSTPNFDQLAADGLLFNNAYVSAPSCTPCRSSLLSGQHFWRCGRGSILQGAIWDFTNEAYPLILEKSGYHIGHTYKVWSPGTPADAPHGGKRTAFVKHGRKFNGFSQNAMAGNDHEAAKAKLFEEVRMNFQSFLNASPSAENDPDSKPPFCYWFGPTNCHRKWVEGSAQELWGINPDDLKGKLPPYLPDVEAVRQDFADYLGEVQAFDAAVGVLVEELKRVGEFENTILVVSGDHGIPGVTRGKCNLYDLGTNVPLAIHWPNGIEHPGRVIDDFVSLPDLAPTFLEIAGAEIPDAMTATSITGLLQSDKQGRIEPTRDAVFTGRERHVGVARAGKLPYPQRAIRTEEHLLIVNFAPERWPMGDGPMADETLPDFAALREKTIAAFGDMDASPTKAWIVTHRDEEPAFYDFAVGRRPMFELYDIKSDPHCMNNLALDSRHAQTRDALYERLTDEMKRTGDPRASENVIFEKAPYTD